MICPMSSFHCKNRAMFVQYSCHKSFKNSCLTNTRHDVAVVFPPMLPNGGEGTKWCHELRRQ